MKNFMKTNQKSALVLGGGGSRGAYEIGVWQALIEMGHTFDMVYGTSIGAINGAMIVQGKFDETLTLWKDLDTSTVFELESDTDLENALELIKKKGASLNGLQKILGKYMNEEDIRNATMDFGLVTVELNNLKPLYMTKKDIPAGRMMDYICASASCFPAIHAYDIDGMKFIDGGYADNVPVGMASNQGATDIIAVNLKSIGLDPKVKLPEGTNVLEISSRWDLGNFMLFKRDNISKIMRLGYLETFKAFGIYHGEYFTFIKDEFDRRDVEIAEKAARMFDLDPEIIYKKSIFLRRLRDAISQFVSLNGEHEANQKKFAAFQLAEKILDSITKFKNEVHPISITLAIAKELSQTESRESLLNNAAISVLIHDELDVAQYLIKEGVYE